MPSSDLMKTEMYKCGDPFTASDVARNMGVSVSTAQTHLRELCDEGVLSRLNNNTYAAKKRLFPLRIPWRKHTDEELGLPKWEGRR